MRRWLISHWYALRTYPSEKGFRYREKVAFEKGVFDGAHWEEDGDTFVFCPRDVPADLFEAWHAGFGPRKVRRYT